MNLIDQKLSALKKGDRVHFTQKNGQIIDGVVVENDKKETLSIQITALTTLKYEQVAMIEEQLGNIPVLRHCTQCDIIGGRNSRKTKKEIEIAKMTSDKGCHCRRHSKQWIQTRKKALTSSYDKCQSSFKSHETKKCEEAANLVWDVMGKKEWDYNPRVNRYYANIQLFLEMTQGRRNLFSMPKIQEVLI